MIEVIMIDEVTRPVLAERFDIEDDERDEMLPIGCVLLTEPGDVFDYDLIEIIPN